MSAQFNELCPCCEALKPEIYKIEKELFAAHLELAGIKIDDFFFNKNTTEHELADQFEKACAKVIQPDVRVIYLAGMSKGKELERERLLKELTVTPLNEFVSRNKK